MSSTSHSMMPVHHAGASANRWLDRVGLFGSIACGIHCLAAPAVLILAPTVWDAWESPIVHQLAALITVPAAAMILFGSRHRRYRLTAFLAVTGIALVLSGVLIPHVGGNPLGNASVPDPACQSACCPSIEVTAAGDMQAHLPPASALTILGSLALGAGHVIRLRSGCIARRAAGAECDPCGC